MRKVSFFLSLVILAFFMSISIAPFAHAAVASGYTVRAWAYDKSTSTHYTTHALTSNSTWVYRSSNSVGAPAAGGFVVTIPANTQSGYLIVGGLYVVSASQQVSTGWTSSYGYPGSSTYLMLTGPYYYGLSSRDEPYALSAPFDGVVYIPAHTSTLYLFVGVQNYYETSTSTDSANLGAFYSSAAYVQFVPEQSAGLTSGDISTSIDNSQTLQNVYNQLQQTFNEIVSSDEQNDTSQAILDDLNNLMSQIDALNEQIAQNTNRPDPGDLVGKLPGMDDYIHPGDGAASTGLSAVSNILGDSFIMPIILMVLGLAFVRYVLFGKAE